jgi:hypothetical protein
MNRKPNEMGIKKERIVQSTPNHATYEIEIITMKRTMRILYPHLLQIPKCEGFCSWE